MKHPIIILAILTSLLAACTDHGEKTTQDQKVVRTEEQPKADSNPISDETPAVCTADKTIVLNGGMDDVQMTVVSSLAVPRIRFNEQTGSGDVAKPGYTICMSDFELKTGDLWARPPSAENNKIELRIFTGDNSPIVAGTYASAAQSNLQIGPMLYMGDNSFPISGRKIGTVEITEVTPNHICGIMHIQTLVGLKVEGNFKAAIVASE